MKPIAVALGLVLFASAAQAQSLKEKYELSERCGKQAAEFFAKEWSESSFPNPPGITTRTSFENHYNSRLNKCLFLVTLDTQMRDKPSAPSYKTIFLLDLHENRQIARYHDSDGTCFGQGMPENERCGSEKEWRALIKPFMED